MKNKVKSLYGRYAYILYAWVVPVYIILFFVEEAVITPDKAYLVSYLPFDDIIPFCEAFIIPYIMWYPFLVGIGLHLMFCEPDTYRRYLVFIGTSFMTVLVLCALFPNGQNLRCDLDALGRDNIFISIVRGIYSADTNTNVCPSIHVVGSMAVIFATFESKTVKKKWFKVLTLLFGILITVSTVFVKQHSVLDIIVAVPYSFIFYFISFKLVKFKKEYAPIYKERGVSRVS